MIFRLEKFFYYLLLIILPIQLGKHFWPNFSFVQGIRVDYLSPTVYLSDIVVFLLFVIFLARTKFDLSFFKNKLFLGSILVISLGLVFAYSREEVVLGLIKYLEIYFVGFYTAAEIRRNDLGKVLYVLSLGAAVEFIIGFLQLISQRSLDGVFYFLGERTFSVTTPAIALFSFDNNLFLRPYGTFPHPNVLGFYFFTVYFLLFSKFLSEKNKWKKTFISLALTITFLGVIFTFSRLLILLLMIFTPLYLALNYKIYRRNIIGAGLIVLGIILYLLSSRFTQTFGRDILLRLDLIKISLNLFLKYPILGVGLNNFYYFEVLSQKAISPIFLQPVHNVYLLILSQTGIAGFILTLFFLKDLFIGLLKPLKTTFHQGVVILVVSVLVVGLFDHFLLTLQQGQILLALILGFSFSKIREQV